MKLTPGNCWAYVLLLIVTAGYNVMVISGLALLNQHLEAIAPVTYWPRITVVFANEATVMLWPILGIVSLIGNVAWGVHRAGDTANRAPHALPMFCHLAWIVACSLWHIAGAMAPFILMGEHL
ncbi:hypothetical protein ACTRW9_06105 [Nitrospina sp. 32_T5]|uniref:hypothetical protein n=1 Tax=unclassified Nitrospina TaxID=2638683 RepID=UPI003F94D9D7